MKSGFKPDQTNRAKPLVSVIISAYNAEKFIGETLRSVFNQTFDDFEVIVVDDGSKDRTLQVVQGFADGRLLVWSQENRGQDAALNVGFQLSKGDYIKFLDSDDLINPEMLELQVAALNGHDNSVAYGEWVRFYDNDPRLTKIEQLDYWRDLAPMDFLTARPEGVMLQCGIMLVPRKLIQKAGLWDERLVLYNDTEFFTRVILASKGIKFTPGARLYYRSGLKGSISVQGSELFFESTFHATCMIGESMLAREDSYRVRNLISNMFLDRYYAMYPRYQKLGEKHLEKAAEYGCASSKPDGGFVFQVLRSVLGWKNAKRMQYVCYKSGYLSVLYPVKLFLKAVFARHRTMSNS